MTIIFVINQKFITANKKAGFFYHFMKKSLNLQPQNCSGCGAVGSALRSGRRGRRFESCHPDKNRESAYSKQALSLFFYLI